ncbi:MAG: hypothetical protein ACMXX7_00250 [Candidatus Woesearchaeota archaeon]
MEHLIKVHNQEVTPTKENLKELFLIYEERYIELCQELEETLQKRLPLLKAILGLGKYKKKYDETEKQKITDIITKKVTILENTKEKIEHLKPWLKETHKKIDAYFENIINILREQIEKITLENYEEFTKIYEKEQEIEKEIEKDAKKQLKNNNSKKQLKHINLPKYHLRGLGAYRIVLIILELMTQEIKKPQKEKYELSTKLKEKIMKKRKGNEEQKFSELFVELSRTIEEELEINENTEIDLEKQKEDFENAKKTLKLLKEAYEIDSEHYDKVTGKVNFLEQKIDYGIGRIPRA